MNRREERRQLNSSIKSLPGEIRYLQTVLADIGAAAERGERIRNDGERVLLMLESVKVSSASAATNDRDSHTVTPSHLVVEFSGSPSAVAQLAMFFSGRMR